MPSCDRSIRWTSSCRRDTGAGNRNCRLGVGEIEQAAVERHHPGVAATAIRTSPPSAGADREQRAAAAAGAPTPGPRLASPRRARRDPNRRAKKLKYK